MRFLQTLAAAAALGGSALAQTDVHTLQYPNQLPYTALQAFHPTLNPFGYPQNPTSGNWPVSLRVGDIDNDGRNDYLLCMEQRLLLALGLTLDAQGNPVSTYVIWARFARNGTINKSQWGVDRATIGDFDGDGLNEVAAVVDPPGAGPAACGTSMRLQILGGTPTPDPNFGNVPRPQVLGEVNLDTLLPGFSNFLIPACTGTGGGPGQVFVGTFNFEGDAKARDILVAESQRGVLAIARWHGPLNGFTTQYAQGYQGPWTHLPYGVDVDGDGRDELLGEGVRNFAAGCYWDIASSSDFSSCYGSGSNHADMLVPWDRDNDGVDEILATHDCYDLVFEPSSDYCNLTISSLPTPLPPAPHGQDVTVMRLVDGPDSFGYDGDCYVATPKGPPIYNGGGSGNQWGSFTRNGNGDVLNLNINTVSPQVLNGPNGWGPANMDWDGFRDVDEVYTKLANRHSIWSLEPDLGPSPPYPYRWVEMGGFDDLVAGQSANAAADVIHDYREEILAAGRFGVQVAGIQALVYPYQHLSPFEDEAYRRRHSGGNWSVDYRSLFELDRLRVSPLTLVTSPGTQTSFTVEGVYVNEAGEEKTRDLTLDAVFQISDLNVGTFSGNVLSAGSDGLAVVNVYVGGYRQEDVPMVLVGTSGPKPPIILHAGYADTYLSQAAGPQPLTVEVRVADYQNDVTGIVVNTAGQPPFAPPQAANDSGLAGDRRAGDGIWTLRMPSVTVTTPHDDYVEAVASDALSNTSLRWPYLQVGTATNVFAGLAANPFESELVTAVPPPLRLLGTGLYPAEFPSGVTGQVTVFVHCRDPRVKTIPGYAQGVSVMPGINDLGQGADAYAGDGLWTGVWTIGTPLSAGRHTLDLLPRNVPEALVGDVYPRLRHHN